MGDTSTTPNPTTQVSSDAATKRVTVIQPSSHTVLTTCGIEDALRFPVRVSRTADRVPVRLDTELLAEQRKTAEANESIRRRSRS